MTGVTLNSTNRGTVKCTYYAKAGCNSKKLKGKKDGLPQQN
jgi:hypothetical protein